MYNGMNEVEGRKCLVRSRLYPCIQN